MADSEDISSNPSDNRPFQDVLDVALSRRSVMVGSLAVAATAFVAPAVVGTLNEGDAADDASRDDQPDERRRRRLIDFEPSENVAGPDPKISPDYEYHVLIPWGTPLFVGTPALDPLDVTSNGSANQERQVGLGHDGMWFFPDDHGRSNSRGVLCINHEFGTNSHCLRKSVPESLEDVRVSQAVHGVAVIELAQENGKWGPVVPGRRNRRITANTPMKLTGPAAKSDLLKTAAGNPVLGTVNNCANGKTPWGTYLTCEENFNGYFGVPYDLTDPDAEAIADGITASLSDERKRYGFSADGFSYFWHLFDSRFDLSDPQFTNEENRFGWIVEIDPNEPDSVPCKRTALGRFKHENAEVVEGWGGRAVVYMGDDQRFDYIYKFVSSGNWRTLRRRGKSPLDEGTLYVAKFNDNYTGEWLELSRRNRKLRDMSNDEILVYARIAADKAGATPMDRPEWITLGQRQMVYATLTNNTDRTPDQTDAANPQGPNPRGHIIRWRDTWRHTGTRFRWDIYVLASATGEDDSVKGAAFSSPDGLWADPDGRLFIETDGGQPFGEDQLVVSDTRTREFRRLFAGVASDEITGLTVTPNRRTMFVNIQHPGNGDPARTNFPVPGAGGPEVPRDSTIVITRKNGGRVGS